MTKGLLSVATGYQVVMNIYQWEKLAHHTPLVESVSSLHAVCWSVYIMCSEVI